MQRAYERIVLNITWRDRKIACEQALLFGQVKRVSRKRASERRSREWQALLFGRVKRVSRVFLGPSFARSREDPFACPNGRACSQANRKTAQWIGVKTKVRDQGTKWNCAGHVAKRTENRWTNRIRSGCPVDTQRTEEDQGRDGRTAQLVS